MVKNSNKEMIKELFEGGYGIRSSSGKDSVSVDYSKMNRDQLIEFYKQLERDKEDTIIEIERINEVIESYYNGNPTETCKEYISSVLIDYEESKDMNDKELDEETISILDMILKLYENGLSRLETVQSQVRIKIQGMK